VTRSDVAIDGIRLLGLLHVDNWDRCHVFAVDKFGIVITRHHVGTLPTLLGVTSAAAGSGQFAGRSGLLVRFIRRTVVKIERFSSRRFSHWRLLTKIVGCFSAEHRLFFAVNTIETLRLLKIILYHALPEPVRQLVPPI